MSPTAFSFLRKMKPMRQIEVAELLVAAKNYSVPHVKALLAATHPGMLVHSEKNKVTEGLFPDQVARMEKEMEALQRDLKLVEERHGNEVFNLVLARGYLARLSANARIVRYLLSVTRTSSASFGRFAKPPCQKPPPQQPVVAQSLVLQRLCGSCVWRVAHTCRRLACM